MKRSLLSFFQRKPSDEALEERNEMIEGIGELKEKSVKEVMVPRVDVQFIDSSITLNDLYSIIEEQGYSRYPVYEQTTDKIVGILYAKDMLRQALPDPFDVTKVMRKPYFIPDSKHLDDLLREFKKRKVHIAIAIDEYGGVSGIVCMEDILEVIVGEIQDEFDDDEEEDIRKVDEHTYLIDARTPIDEVNEVCGLSLNDDELETIGGYVFELFGRIPQKGEKIEEDGAIFVVEDIDGHKINGVKLLMNSP
ncbi:MAG: hemolysin family protein [Sphaerochaeta sp.]